MMMPVARRSSEDSLGKRPTTRVRRLICELSVSQSDVGGGGDAAGDADAALLEAGEEVAPMHFGLREGTAKRRGVAPGASPFGKACRSG